MSYKAFKFRMYPTKDQEHLFLETVGSCRFVYNKLLEMNLEYYKESSKFRFGYALLNLIPSLKKTHPFLKNVNSQSLQQSSMNLSTAFKNRFSKKRKSKSGFPKFKKRGIRDSFVVPQHFTIENSRIKLPKIGWVRVKNHQKLEGKAKSLTISKDVDSWYVSILCEIEQPIRYIDPANAVGIDMGIKTFATTSDGELIEAPKLSKHEKRLKLLQRRLSKKQKQSRNREKARLKVARQYQKIRNINKDFIEKTTTMITKSYDVVSLETLNIKGMKANRRLSGAIQRLSWYAFKEALKRKVGYVHEVGRFYPSSKTCSSCGHIKDKMPLDIRTYDCESCGYIEDRDVNAARNLVNEYYRTVGTTGIACGEHIRLIEPSGSLAMFDEAGINSSLEEAIHPLG